MGFFSYFILKGPSHEQVFAYLKSLRRRAAVSITVNGITVVADEELRGEPVIWRKFENPEVYDSGNTGWEPFVSEWSASLHCRALAVEVHDNDVLYYQLRDSGRMIDEYNSHPDYFGARAFEWLGMHGGPAGPDRDALRGNARLLCETFDALEWEAEVDAILHKWRDKSASEASRYFPEEDIIQALHLPAFAQRAEYHLACGDIQFRRERGLAQQFTLTDE